MKRLRVALICDFIEEEWHSMNLVAEMLSDGLATHYSKRVSATLIRPPMQPILQSLPLARRTKLARNGDRVINRHWLYPRRMSALKGKFDLFHVIDHSYAHLVHGLPQERVVVTCHDLDAFADILFKSERPTTLGTRCYGRFSRTILTGLRKAATVVCDSETVKRDVIRHKLNRSSQTFVAPLGAHSSYSPESDTEADVEAGRLLGATGPFLLHVGSTIPRKRIDVLLKVFAAVLETHREIRLVRVGGQLTAEQTRLARSLDLPNEAVLLMPHISREILAAVYRRAAVVLQPSDGEGFGLPVIEAMACGTPVVASDLAVLREVGGAATSYCLPADINSWVDRVNHLLAERKSTPEAWLVRQRKCLEQAANFSWHAYTDRMMEIYESVYVH